MSGNDSYVTKLLQMQTADPAQLCGNSYSGIYDECYPVYLADSQTSDNMLLQLQLQLQCPASRGRSSCT